MSYSHDYRKGEDYFERTCQLSLRIPNDLMELMRKSMNDEGYYGEISFGSYVRRLLEQGVYMRTKLKVG